MVRFGQSDMRNPSKGSGFQRDQGDVLMRRKARRRSGLSVGHDIRIGLISNPSSQASSCVPRDSHQGMLLSCKESERCPQVAAESNAKVHLPFGAIWSEAGSELPASNCRQVCFVCRTWIHGSPHTLETRLITS